MVGLYLAEQLATIAPEHREVICTKDEAVVCNNGRDEIANLAPCKHEEANSRLILHVADAARCGYTKVMIRTVDTDIVIIAVTAFQHITLSQLWIAFGVGKHLRYLSVHDISCSMGQEKSQALLAFHSCTGSDQTSFFACKGKKTAWEAWNMFKQITAIFHGLNSAPSLSAVSDAMPIIERYVAIVYDSTSTCTKVNEAWKDVFTRKGRETDALLQHTKRSMYQAGHCWGKSLVPSYQSPCRRSMLH